MGKIDPYKSSGVDTELADSLVDWLKDEKTPSKSPLGHIVSGIGPFAGIFKCNFEGIKKPLLISSTDGVGTKLLLGL